MAMEDEYIRTIRPQVLIVGSGLSISLLDEIDIDAWIVVALNKAWKYKPEVVDYIVHMPFLPESSRPQASRFAKSQIIGVEQCIPAACHYAVTLGSEFSGNHKALSGNEIHFYASYWAMFCLCAGVLGYIGCDLDYDGPQTHFYGRGQQISWVDRSREDLDVYFDRQLRVCAKEGVSLINLSMNPKTRLPYPKGSKS
ncbi:MAG: hypothetical protein ABI158_11035 [Edaphobacter sp.]